MIRSDGILHFWSFLSWCRIGHFLCGELMANTKFWEIVPSIAEKRNKISLQLLRKSQIKSQLWDTVWNLNSISSVLQKPIPFPFCNRIPSDSEDPNIKMAFEYTRSLTGVVYVFPDTTWGSENTPSWWWGYFLRDLRSSIRAASETPHCVFSRHSMLKGQQVGLYQMLFQNWLREMKKIIFLQKDATSKFWGWYFFKYI